MSHRFLKFLILKDIKIESIDQKFQQFFWMGGFCLLVELHLEGSAPTACKAGLFWTMSKYELIFSRDRFPRLLYIQRYFFLFLTDLIVCKPIVIETFSFHRQLSVCSYTDSCVFAPTTALLDHLVSNTGNNFRFSKYWPYKESGKYDCCLYKSDSVLISTGMVYFRLWYW